MWSSLDSWSDKGNYISSVLYWKINEPNKLAENLYSYCALTINYDYENFKDNVNGVIYSFVSVKS